jgi:hypothetical protein
LLKTRRIFEEDFENPPDSSKVIIRKEPTDIILLKSHFIRKQRKRRSAVRSDAVNCEDPAASTVEVYPTELWWNDTDKENTEAV